MFGCVLLGCHILGFPFPDHQVPLPWLGKWELVRFWQQWSTGIHAFTRKMCKDRIKIPFSFSTFVRIVWYTCSDCAERLFSRDHNERALYLDRQLKKSKVWIKIGRLMRGCPSMNKIEGCLSMSRLNLQQTQMWECRVAGQKYNRRKASIPKTGLDWVPCCIF